MMKKLLTLSLALLASFSLWADFTPTAAPYDTYVMKNVSNPGGAKRFNPMANGGGIYWWRGSNVSIDTSLGIKMYTSSKVNDGGVVFCVTSATNLEVEICYKDKSNIGSYTVTVSTLADEAYQAIQNGTQNSTEVTVTDNLSSPQSHSYTFPNPGSSEVTVYDTASFYLVPGYYYVTAIETTTRGKLRWSGLKISAAGAPTCPSGLSISGEQEYTEGDKIELNAALEAGNGNITYQWYKGGKAEGNKLTGKTAAKLEIANCAVSDAGDYYCVASKDGCDDAVNASAYAVTVNEDTRCFIMPEITSQPSDLAHVIVTGGTLADVGDGKALKMTGTGISFSSGNAARLQITLTSTSIVEGTKITIYYNNASSDGSGIGLYNEYYEHQVIGTTGVTGSGSVSHTFTAAEAAYYGDVLLIDRNSTGKGIIVGRIEIEDCGPALETYTITFDSDGGSAVTAIEVKEGMSGKKPTDPTKANYRFDSWVVKSTGVAYDWSAAVTADIELKATWTQLYTVTYAKGDEGADGTMTDSNSPYAAGDNVTLLTNTFTAPSGKEFDAWVVTETVSGDAVSVSAGKFTMPAAAVTVTATWKTEIPRYKVAYYDGETKLGDEVIVVGEHPTAIGVDSIKNHSIIAAWQRNSVDINLNDVSGAKNDSITLFARYTDHYSSSVNIEQLILDYGTSYDIQGAFDAAGIVYADLNDLDSLAQVKKTNSNIDYLGLKIKKEGGYIEMLVKAGQTLKVKFGAIAAALKLTIDEVAQTDIAKSTSVYEFTAEGNDKIVKIATSSGSTVVLKQIMINEAIAVVRPYKAVVTATTNGTASVELEKYAKGETVTVNNTPATGYELNAISVLGYKYAGSKDSVIVVNGNTFEMPGSEVDINVTFVALNYTVTLAAGTYAKTGGEANIDYDATALDITTAPAGTGALLGFFTAASEGTKVANADGSLVEGTVEGYVTEGKWSRASATTLYAVYDGVPTALDNTVDELKAVKFFENGKLFIRRGDKVFDAQGQLVK